jgi:hypothetical protein
MFSDICVSLIIHAKQFLSLRADELNGFKKTHRVQSKRGAAMQTSLANLEYQSAFAALENTKFPVKNIENAHIHGLFSIR